MYSVRSKQEVCYERNALCAVAGDCLFDDPRIQFNFLSEAWLVDDQSLLGSDDPIGDGVCLPDIRGHTPLGCQTGAWMRGVRFVAPLFFF